MRKLVSLRQLVDEATEDGVDLDTVMIDREDIAELDEETLDVLENPDSQEER